MSAKKRKSERRNQCYGRCRTWFFNRPELIDPCKDACYNHDGLTKDEFLCSGRFLDEAEYIRKYRQDPCPGIGYTLEEILGTVPTPEAPPPAAPAPYTPPPFMEYEEVDEDETEDETSGNTKTIVWIVVGVLVLGMAALFVFKK